MKKMLIFLGFTTIMGWARLMLVFGVSTFFLFKPTDSAHADRAVASASPKIIMINEMAETSTCFELNSKVRRETEHGVTVYKPKTVRQTQRMLAPPACINRF